MNNIQRTYIIPVSVTISGPREAFNHPVSETLRKAAQDAQMCCLTDKIVHTLLPAGLDVHEVHVAAPELAVEVII